MSYGWWACDWCGERQLTSKRGKACILTPRCGGRLTVPSEAPGKGSG